METANYQAVTSKTYKSFMGIILNVFGAALGSFGFGYGIGVFNTLKDTLTVQLGWADDKEAKTYAGMINSFMAATALIGALACGNFTAAIGRRKTIFLADLITIIGCGIQVVGSTATLLVGRLVFGLAVGLNSAVIPLYISEISPTELSGLTGSFHQIFICLGILISFVMGFGIPPKTDAAFATSNWWKIMAGAPIAIAALRFLVFLVIYRNDTPTYLVSNGQYEEAETVLNQIYLPENVGEKLALLRDEKNKQDGSSNGASVGAMFGPRYRKALFIGCFLSFLQQFSGINAVMFYSNTIFKGGKTGEEADREATFYTVLVGIFNLVSAFLCGLILDKGGRKTLLLGGDVLMMIVLFTLGGLGFADITSFSKFLILAYVFLFGMSLGPIVWVYISEILPEKGVSLAVATNWICTLIVAQGFEWLKDTALTINGCFLLFGAVCALGLFVVLIFAIETKGKSKNEIQRLYGGEESLLDGTTYGYKN